MLRGAAAALLLVCLVSIARTEPILPADKSIESVVDHYIKIRLDEEKVVPAPLADDYTLIRRTTLDLVGRIPTPAEVKAFVESKDADKRVKLVDRLLATGGFVRHQASMFDAMMIPPNSNRGGLRDYFVKALGEGRSWDKVFKELVNPPLETVNKGGAGDFLKSRVSDLDRLTNDVSVLFFGVNVSCAQCHNHPLVQDWKQDHYYGMKAFFNRTFDNGGFLAEREFGVVKFKPPKGPERQAKMMFLTGKPIEDPSMREPTKDEAKVERELFEKHKKDKTAPPAPKFSGRSKLVEIALQGSEADFFSKNIANRLWHRFMGRGLVMPLDQMHSENPPSHPELLEWLARDIAAHQYDLKRTIRGLVLSQAYARSSRLSGGSEEAPPEPQLFAVARLKPLTPSQMAASLKVALSDPKSFENVKPEDLDKRMEGYERSGIASSLVQPSDDFQIGVTEALLFSNSDRINKEYLTEGKDNVLGVIKEMMDKNAACEVAIQSLFCRKPMPNEIAALTAYLDKRSDRLPEAYRQMLWAMITSAEFRFNH